MSTRELEIGQKRLPGALTVPTHAGALIVFAHGSGSGRLSPRNRAAADALNAQGMATLLFDLLTPEEERDRANVFDIPLLAERLVEAVRWVDREGGFNWLPLGLFGASTGAAAALVAAASLSERIGAVVSRGGRPDLAGRALAEVIAPTLLIVGGLDVDVMRLNQDAVTRLAGERKLEIVAGATHLFPEPRAMDAVIALAAAWFESHLTRRHRG